MRDDFEGVVTRIAGALGHQEPIADRRAVP
jgi:hypothetical protein